MVAGNLEEPERVGGDVVVGAKQTEARIKDAIREGRKALWDLAEALWSFDTQDGWAQLGYKDLSAWLEDPQIDMTRGTYYRYVNLWDKLVAQKGINPERLRQLSASKADLVANDVVEGSVRPAAALRDVQSLSARELREKYGQPARGRPTKARAPERHSPSTAMLRAAELPWDFVDDALHKRSSLNLREARLREVLQALLDWRREFLP